MLARFVARTSFVLDSGTDVFESLVLSWYTALQFLAQTVCLRCLLGPSSNQARQHLVRAVRVRKVPAGVEANIQAVLCTQKYYQYSTNGTSSTGSCTEQDFFLKKGEARLRHPVIRSSGHPVIRANIYM